MVSWSLQVEGVRRPKVQVCISTLQQMYSTRLMSSTIIAPEESGSASGFKPTRRVRDAPGGKSSIFFGGDDVEEETPAPSRKAAVRPHLTTSVIVII
jgi:hypothetical protein